MIENSLHHNSEQLATLLKMSQALNESLLKKEVLQTTTDSATDLMDVDSAAIYLLKGEKLYLGATTPPLDPKMPESFRYTLLQDHPHLKKSVTTFHPVILDDATTVELTHAEKAIAEARGLRTIIYIPILRGKRVLGALILGTVGIPRKFTDTDLSLCQTLAIHIAVSIKNSSLLDKVNRYSKKLEDLNMNRKQAVQRLKRNEALLNAIQKISMVGGWEWNVEKQTMFWTDEVYRIHDFRPSDFAPDSLKHIDRSIECYNPEDRPRIAEAFRNCTENGQAYDMEFPYITKSGEEKWLEHNCSPVYDEQGNYAGRRGNNRDITERKLTEEELREHRGRLEDLVKVRTADLERKNEKLDWFNQLFVGREFRIKELRNQVEALEKSLGDS